MFTSPTRQKRTHVLNLSRIAVTVIALCAAYVGFEEARLRVHCPEPIAIAADELSKDLGAPPYWLRLEARVAQADAALVASDSGNGRGVWVPVLSQRDPSIAVAILEVESMADARELQAAKQPVKLEGIAHSPGRGEKAVLGSYLAGLRMKRAAGLMILEVGRAPRSLAGSVCFLLAGALVAGWAIKGLLLQWRRAADAQRFHTIPPYQGEPHGEEIVVEVRHMLDGVWEGTKQR